MVGKNTNLSATRPLHYIIRNSYSFLIRTSNFCLRLDAHKFESLHLFSTSLLLNTYWGYAIKDRRVLYVAKSLYFCMAKEVIFTKVRLHQLVQDQVVKVKHFARYIECPGEERRLLKFRKCCTKGRGRRGLKLHALARCPSECLTQLNLC